MSAARSLSQFVLRITPSLLKKGLRQLFPNGFYRAFARASRGERILRWPFKKRPAKKIVHRYTPSATTVKLIDKLWGGFANKAVGDLEQMRTSARSTPNQAIGAALELARYYAAKENHEDALERLAFVRNANAGLARSRKLRILETHCLLMSGQLEEARFTIERNLALGASNDGCMNAALASLSLREAEADLKSREKADAEYLEAMSRPLVANGFTAIAKRDPDEKLRLGNLKSVTDTPKPEHMPVKVSVLMAVFNGGVEVEQVIRSILEQSWSNLELVVADDASTDNTWEVISRLAAEDSRINAIRQEKNGGAYVARNAALAKATGDFVVVNDADDWAHPQKIEAQVCHLLDNPECIGNMTFRIRVAPDMTAQPRLDSPHVPIIHNDYSALMLPRELAIEMGGWDAVRFSADAEFVERLRAIKGADAVEKIYSNVPLSFSLYDGNNLTASSATSIWTNRFGSRQEYVRQFQEWHKSGENLKTRRTSQLSPFPVPGISYYGKDHTQEFDIVLVSDFRLPGGTTHCNLEYLASFHEQGLRVAVLPWPRYELNYKHTMNPKVTRLCREQGIVPLAHGEKAKARLVLIHHPPIMMNMLDMTPDIEADTVAVLANQTAQRVRGGENDMYEPAIVEENVQRVFGKLPVWIPISGLVRTLMAEVEGHGKIHSEDWLPPINVSTLSRRPTWRGEERDLPVIGRHSRDQWIKWPEKPEDIMSAYLGDTEYKVRLMGGVDTPRSKLDAIPENWEVLEFDAQPIKEFLADLDFFVHFGHPDALEAFGRNIAEAMAAGIPVICSPSFKECFGNTAVYAEPHEVEGVIEKLWRNEKGYYKQASAGQEFIRTHCDRTKLQSRLHGLLPGEPASVSNA